MSNYMPTNSFCTSLKPKGAIFLKLVLLSSTQKQIWSTCFFSQPISFDISILWRELDKMAKKGTNELLSIVQMMFQVGCEQ